jgi:hypothetical protein
MLRPRLGRSSSSPGWALSGWAGTQPPGRADSSPGRRPLILPGWACLPAGLAGMVPPAGPGLAHPAGLLPLTRLGRCPAPRLGQVLQPRLGRCAPPGRLSHAGIPSPCRDSLSRLAGFCLLFRPGRDSLAQAGLLLSWTRFTPSGTYHSSSIAPSASCPSWDASRLGLAYPSPSYAGLGTLLGSDQHIPPLLVSLILWRRIRLMTW